MTIEPDPINKGCFYVKQHDGRVIAHAADEKSAVEWVKANGLEAWLTKPSDGSGTHSGDIKG